MFASLKNKIREETGSDVTTVVRNAGTVRSINSKYTPRTDSASSISESQISADENQEDSPPPSSNSQKDQNFELKLADGTVLQNKDKKKLNKREDEWRKRLEKKETELLKKMEKRDEEWRIKFYEKEKNWKKIAEDLEKDKKKLLEEKNRADNARRLAENALQDAEEYKKKLNSFQEDTEQLEGFQAQEMAKIKHLLLTREQELDDKTNRLKLATIEVETMKSEISRLRRFEDELENVQDDLETLRHSSQREKSQLSSQLAKTEEEVRYLKEKISVLEQRITQNSNHELTTDERIIDFMRERTLLERKLEEAHLHLSDIKTSWSGKISSLETQVGRLSRQAGEEGLERRRVEEEKDKLKVKIQQLEAEMEVKNVVIAAKDAKLVRMSENIEEMAMELKELQANADYEIEEFTRKIERSSTEIKQLKFELKKTTDDLSHASEKLSRLRSSYETEKKNNLSLKNELSRLQENSESEKTTTATLRVCLEKERDEKNSTLFRIAQVSQDLQLMKQNNQRLEMENNEQENKIENLEKVLKSKSKDVDDYCRRLEETHKKIEDLEESQKNKENMEGNEKVLKNNLTDLEEQLMEKTKMVKVLQQRLTDMKKTLQRELRVPSSTFDSDAENSSAVLNPSSSKTVTTTGYTKEKDVNFEYLKHVLIKFLTSREYEALHLTRAVATLLHFSPDEEKLLQETLEYKMSWFGTRPNLGIGQTAKAIPPS